MEISINKGVGVLVKTTCVDFPGLTATSFFLKGCNLRCPYCYNKELVIDTQAEASFSSIQDFFNHLEKRKGIISGVVISGGEPLINPYTPIIIKKAKELNYKVKIDTNGIFPDKLEKILSDNELKPDFIAVDIKTSPSKYANLICGKNSIFFGNEHYFEENLKQTCDLVATFPQSQREFRTVLVPPLVQKEDIKNMATFLPKDACWQFAQFKNQNCFDSSYNDIYPYTDEEAKSLIEYAKTFIVGANLR